MHRKLSLFLFPAFAAFASAAMADEATARLAIDNMHCALCPVTVRKSMEGVDGVLEANVDFETSTAVVRYDDERTNPDEIAEASTAAGYPAKPFSK